MRVLTRGNSLFFLGKGGTLETLVTLFLLFQEKSNELVTSFLVLLFDKLITL